MAATTTLHVPTREHAAMINLTREIRDIIRSSGVRSGLCCIFNPHTTAGLTINEQADPDVVHDMIRKMDSLIPWQEGYRHSEGNSAAHIKTTLFGPSLTIIIEDGAPLLGTWQGIWFCEFDGPRQRRLHVKILADT